MKSGEHIEVRNIDHLGLVGGIIDEIGLVEQINQLLGQHLTEKVSAGHVVKAMILNGLGFVSGALYIFSKYFEGKACEHLIGEGVKPEYLNDDRLGRVLDQLYIKGLSQVFMTVALAAAKKYGFSRKSAHLDSTSFHLHGEYNSTLPSVTFTKKKQNSSDEAIEEETLDIVAPQPVNITYGYSRDHRPDLKQFILDLICSGDGDVPLFLKVASGNESDQKVFAQILVDFKKQIDFETLMIADSALYSAANIALMKKLKWLCRVPLTVQAAKQLVSSLSEQEFVKSQIDGYSYAVKTSNYGGVEQRWLIVESQARKVADLRQLEKRVSKSFTTAQKKLQKLSNEEFACHQDAIKAAEKLSKQLKYYTLTNLQIIKQPSQASKKSLQSQAGFHQDCYYIKASLKAMESMMALEMRSAGRFVLATNVLHSAILSHDEMISEYKAQQSCERGFGFLKDPLFFTDSVFLKSPERIEALAMVMGLCLLVYTLAQRQLRVALSADNSEIKNQLGKGTARPTLRWVFQCFQAIHLLIINGIKQISNITDERLWILRFFPTACHRYYLLD